MLKSSVRHGRMYNVKTGSSFWFQSLAVEQRTYPRKNFATSGSLLKKYERREVTEKGTQSDQPKVKWYQQILPWSTKRERIDGDLAMAADYDEAKWLKDHIRKDDAALREMEGVGGKTAIEPLLATLSSDDAQKIRDAIRIQEREDARKEKAAALLAQQLAESLPKKEELAIRCQVPWEQSPYLENFNENIFRASRNVHDQDLATKLWQSYERCKAYQLPLLHLIPEQSWGILWTTLQTTPPDNSRWASRVIKLCQDMVKIGRKLDLYQRIIYIEALKFQHLEGQAIEEWRELEKDIGDDTKALEEHELLGVRLFASLGDAERAEKIALNHLSADKSGEYRILIPILHAWAQRGDDVGLRHAWALYLRFRMSVGAKITMEDYDNISLGFLSAGRTDVALAVFKDLMLTGHETDQGSMELFNKSMALIGRRQSNAITVEDINRTSLTALLVLPRKFENKFFYASWLKKLLGMRAVDAAAQVIELMYERDVKPDAKHLGGIIGAWLRAGSDREREAAEKMAWAMIHERLNFVELRRHSPNPDSSDLLVPERPDPQQLRRSVAPANIETFCLLLQHYGRRSQNDKVQLIKETLRQAEISPNSYFINHLLYIDLRRGQHQAAWIKYKDMFGPVKPDLETFVCLWKCEKNHLRSLVVHTRDKFPNPRRIMSEMMTWFSLISCKPGDRAVVGEEFNRELYEQIVLCMGRASDLEGMLVSIYALKESFGLYPDGQTMRQVTIAVSRLKPAMEEFLVPHQRPRTGRDQRKANADRVAKVFAFIIQQREVKLAKNGLDDLAQFDEYVQAEETLFRIAEFLRTILRKTSVDEESMQRNIEKAAWEMGVSGIRMEDPLSSYGVQKGRYKIGGGD